MNHESVKNQLFQPSIESTCCRDPKATHIVTVAGEKFGYGIYGYYTNIWDAKTVQNELLKAGAKISGVETYDPTETGTKGIHPLITAHLNGYV